MASQPMKKKRGAERDLTHDNWDQEDNEVEEAGEFKRASDDVIQERKMSKPTRRLGSAGGEEKKSNPFSGFGGFGKSDTKSLPAFGTSFKKNPVTKPLEEKSEKKDPVPNFWANSDNNTDFFANRGKENMEINEKGETASSKEKSSDNNSMSDTYLQELSALNVSVLSWIKTHVDENPCIDLTPVFKDYEKHYRSLEAKHKSENNSGSNKTESKPIINPSFNMTPSTVASTFSTKPISMFAALTPIVPKPDNTKTTTQFPSNYFSSTPFPKPQSDKTEVAADKKEPTIATTTNEGEATEVVNPEPERKVIEEKDAFHQIRCKLFFKKGSQFQELGIGMLYLKPNGNNVQLLVRMESVTGKVLLNIGVSKETPTSRSGKNNVMVVSVPNPPVFTIPDDGDNTKPCTYLIRVKGTMEADDLLEKIKSGNK